MKNCVSVCVAVNVHTVCHSLVFVCAVRCDHDSQYWTDLSMCTCLCGPAVCLLYFHVSHWLISVLVIAIATYARFLAPWLTAPLPWWNPKDVGTNHTTSSSFLWVLVSMSLFFSSLVPPLFCLWTTSFSKRKTGQNTVYDLMSETV